LINGLAYHYELDWRGMPIRLWSQEGSLVWQGNADAWGKCAPEGDMHQPIRLPGQFEDELTGLYNNRFRDYCPDTGRYLTPDPIGLNGGLNSYRYTKNPIDYIDPLGLKNEPAVTAANAHEGDESVVPDGVPAVSEVSKFDYAVGAGELIVKGAWNGLVEVAAGLGGLGTVLITRDGDAGKAVVEGVREQHSWDPTTDGAQAIGEAVAPVFETYEAGKESLGEVGMEQDSPALATALYTAPDAVMAIAGGFLGRGVMKSAKKPSGISPQVAQAQRRQAQMLDDNVGYNVSPTAWDKYPTIGRNGTFVSDRNSISDVIGDISGKNRTTISRAEASRLERDFGLEPSSLDGGFKVRRVDGIADQSPRSPLEGNQYFRGPGQHLPGGAPEMVVDSIPTADTGSVRTILEVNVQ
ncbi:MAG: hypothetical protein EA349_15490, partial [Halomonadaceae bacterium]